MSWSLAFPVIRRATSCPILRRVPAGVRAGTGLLRVPLLLTPCRPPRTTGLRTPPRSGKQRSIWSGNNAAAQEVVDVLVSAVVGVGHVELAFQGAGTDEDLRHVVEPGGKGSWHEQKFSTSCGGGTDGFRELDVVANQHRCADPVEIHDGGRFLGADERFVLLRTEEVHFGVVEDLVASASRRVAVMCQLPSFPAAGAGRL